MNAAPAGANSGARKTGWVVYLSEGPGDFLFDVIFMNLLSYSSGMHYIYCDVVQTYIPQDSELLFIRRRQNQKKQCILIPIGKVRDI